MIRAEIEKLKSQEQNDHQNNNLHDIIEKTIEEEVEDLQGNILKQ